MNIMDKNLKNLLKQHPNLSRKEFITLIDNVVCNLIGSESQFYEVGLSTIIYNYYETKNPEFEWNCNIRNLSQCSLHEFIYIFKLGIDHLNKEKKLLNRPLYSIKDLLTFIIEKEIDGTEFNTLNKTIFVHLFSHNLNIKPGSILKLRKFLFEFEFENIEKGTLCVIPIVYDH